LHARTGYAVTKYAEEPFLHRRGQISRKLSGMTQILGQNLVSQANPIAPKMGAMNQNYNLPATVRPAESAVKLKRATRLLRILEPSAQKLSPVKETTLYPAQFPILLRERLQGKTIAEAADLLGLPADQFVRLLEGQWRPSKEICRKMGLRVVYAVTDTAAAGIA
jgi:hypothetical protein